LILRPVKLFRSIDYLAFVCGVYLLGCLVGVPVILRYLIPLEYVDTFIWSLLACTIVVGVVRTNGTVSLLRVGIAVILSGAAFALFAHHPMIRDFLLCGVLSVLVLLQCGKFTTTLARAYRGRMNGFGLAILGCGLALFMWFVFGQLNGIFAYVVSLTGTIVGLAATIYGCKLAVQGRDIAPQTLTFVHSNRL